jgi:predicted dehydrogenase
MGASTTFESAAFAVLGFIALHGVRLSRCSLGETVLVIGLGLVGQFTVSLLAAAGCRVIGTDIDAERCEMAKRMGAEKAAPKLSAAAIGELALGTGVDAVLITASTKSNDPIELAIESVRKKGRIVLVGVVGLEFDRRPFYFKEAEFVVSCSYGPGRYDPFYEEQGHDYPRPYVRWTEQRNIQAVLDLMANGTIDVEPLISHRFDFENASNAYQLIKSGSEKYLGVILAYAETSDATVSRQTIRLRTVEAQDTTTVGVLGAGNFARMILLPSLFRVPSVRAKTICSSGGVSAGHTGRKLGFEIATTDVDSVFADPEIDAVFVLTRHDQHARQVLGAIKANKHVFVEKPLCLTMDELNEIEQAYRKNSSLLMVGFNRRFTPATKAVREFFAHVRSPLTLSIRFNAGPIPSDHWTHDDLIGGGRIIGEACHAIDLATFLCGAAPVKVYAESVASMTTDEITDDQCHLTLRHANGSISQITYVSSGDKAYPKERIEVFGGGRVAVIDDFRSVTTCCSGKLDTKRMRTQDKGHAGEVDAFLSALRDGGGSPIIWRDIHAVSLASILAVRSLREGVPFEIPLSEE